MTASPRKFGVWFSYAVVGCTALVCAAIVVAVLTGAGLRQLTAVRFLFLLVAPSAVFGTLAYILLRRQERVRRTAVEISMVALSLVAIEALIMLWRPEWRDPHRDYVAAARELRVPFDSRTAMEVVRQMREAGIDAFPSVPADWARREPVRSRLPADFYPLSHAANVSVVQCNEGGEYLVYKTDEFGFNNPPGLLAQRSIDVAVVGESTALGHCVPTAESLVSRLRKKFPALGNFAIAGSGNLTALAAFREYVEPLRPRLVVWVPNLSADKSEFADPVLIRYLEPNFSQHLRQRQNEIDQAICTIAIPAQAEFELAVRAQFDKLYDLSKVPKLGHLRYLFWQQLSQRPQLQPSLAPLMLARTTTRRWGGDLAVLLLPNLRYHPDLGKMLTSGGFTVIDARRLFEPDPGKFYHMRMSSHPNAAGHALLAEFVASRIQKLLPRRADDLQITTDFSER